MNLIASIQSNWPAALMLLVVALAAFFFLKAQHRTSKLVPACNIAGGTHAGFISKLTSAPIGESYLLCKFEADAGHIGLAGKTDTPIGVLTDEAEEAEDPVNVALLGSSETTIQMRAGGAIVAGDYLVPDDNGRVRPLPAAPGKYTLVGRALTAAAAGELVEADPIAAIPVTV